MELLWTLECVNPFCPWLCMPGLKNPWTLDAISTGDIKHLYIAIQKGSTIGGRRERVKIPYVQNNK